MGYTESDTGIASQSAFLSNFAVSSFYLAKFSPQGQRLWATYLCESDTLFLDEWKYGWELGNNYPVFDLDVDSSNHV
ncbi:MAG TPA: hypothetical protein VLZ83_04440 [Edaphocola sp.]|nr:hypothetical protein [Edaphocola sp.]